MASRGRRARTALGAATAGLIASASLAAVTAIAQDSREAAVAPPPALAEEMEVSLAALALAPPQRAGEVAEQGQLQLERGRVLVEVLTRPALTAWARERIERLGGTVQSGGRGLLAAQLPVGRLAQLGRDRSVRYLQAPLAPLPDSVTGEGVAISGAGAVHARGITGAGTRIAVVDAGFGGYASAVAEGDLPGGLPTFDLCTNVNSSSHGTQVAEIVHEMAPGAQLYLVCTDLAPDDVPALAYIKAQGVHVISRSLGSVGQFRGDGNSGSGTTDPLAEEALAAGILWVNSAGNYARSHWSGNFTDTDSDNFLNFSGGDELNSLTIGAGNQDCFRTKWDGWPATALNYDVRLYRMSDLTLVAQGNNPQTGTQPPRESFCYTNPGPTQAYGLALVRVGPPTGADPRIDVFAVDTFSLQHQVAASSVSDTVGAPEILSVAALCSRDSVLEGYSSRGPTIAGRVAPEISGYSDISNSFTASTGCGSGAGSGFGGTSAAAPHVAGAAALYRQATGLGPEGLRAALEGGARELGEPGKDNSYGHGALRVQLGPCAGRTATIVGTKGNDVLRGSSRPDTIIGLEGDDRISGLGGRDRICGGPGRDKLRGGGGADRLLGQAGNDKLFGGKGKDRVKGGAGKDVERR